MRIVKNFKQNAFIVLFILHVSLLSDFSFNSDIIVSQKSENNSSFFPDFDSDLADKSSLKHYFSKNEGIIPTNHKITNENDAFQAILDLINPQALNNEGLTGENVTIAILDSGINEVEWIKNIMVKNTTIFNSTQVDDDNGHGTFVASIISKIAPNASLISIKVSDSTGLAKPESIEAGLKLALEYNSTIIHTSVGTTNLESVNSSLITDLNSRNITTVFAAGNIGPFASSLSSPAIYAETIVVGMAYNQTHLPITTSRGPRPSGLMGPDLVAPGVNIVGYDHRGKFVSNTGTSYAASFVTGALALLKEAFPDKSPTTLKAALLETAQFMNNISPIRQGNGFLDISKAYELLKTVNINNPLFIFAPREISSYFIYFGHAVNGINRTYHLSLYSTINSNLTEINTYQVFSDENATQKFPINVTVGSLPKNITSGLNIIDISLKIPENLTMAKREGYVKFYFSNGIYSSNLSIIIENRYPGGNILFYQGYDNETFIPDGPTGEFSQLQYFLELYYGMVSWGATKPDSILETYGPLIETKQSNGKITTEDLNDHNILVLTDIDLEISDQEIAIIQEWVSSGRSLLVLYDGIEIYSNPTNINKLLKRYGFSIDQDLSSPPLFSHATTSISDPIFEEKGWDFDYAGTSINVSPKKGGNILATAIDQVNDEEHNVAGYWEDPESKGKVIVFGGFLPFNDLGVNFSKNNIMVISRIFRWMLQDQQLPLDILLTSPSPTKGQSTQIQLTINEANFIKMNIPYFNGTIIEANGSFSQIVFRKRNNIYLGSWKPLTKGQAILWLNLKAITKTPTNGVFAIEVLDTSSQNSFFLLIIGGFVLLGVVYFLLSSRKPQRQSPIEQRVALELQKGRKGSHPSGLETLQICPQCNTQRYEKGSKYCFNCGKEL
ncbi:MAG: S8 family serine peptidase [Promethearchaeota archaeon]